MAKGTRFTDKFIASLKPAEKEYWTREGQGFAIRVLPSGEKVWYYIYTFEGRKRFMRLKEGGYPDVTLADAREAFDIAKVKVKNGIDPLAETQTAKEERRKAPTVADLITEYLEKHVKVNKRGWIEGENLPWRHEDERILQKDVLPAWGKRKAADISKRDVVLLLEKIVERGSPGSANGNFKCIRKMFAFAVERDILTFSPCIGVKMPAPLNSRERTLSETEVKTLWANLGAASVSDEIRRAIKLIFTTAQRPGEVIGMHSREIDETGRWWTIPSERSKNGKAHRVYLTDTALELIGDTTGKGYIFPCPHEGKEQPIAVNALAHAVRRNLAWPVLHKGKPVFDADGKPVTENRLGVDHFTPHDGRRTAATFMSQIGFMDEVIDAVLNHVKQGIIKTYNQNKYDAEKQQALEAWERKLLSIVTAKPKPDNVTNINQGRRKAA